MNCTGMYGDEKKPMKKRRTKILLILLAVLLCLLLPGFYNALKVVHYTVNADNVAQPIRVALVADLHSCAYGEDQRELLEAIEKEAPDLLLLGGDIFDDQIPNDRAAAFLKGIQGKYPCYYVAGNHEYWSGKEGFAEKMAILDSYGVIRLSGDMDTIEIKGTKLNICGVDDPYAWANNGDLIENRDGSYREQVERVAELAENGHFTILLAHRPELFSYYSQFGFDLVLSGHAHGGQWRIPGILDGVYAPNQGLFPAYAGGRYEQNGTVMIVSRGLARESTHVPRFYNRPELVMIDLISE